MAAESETRGAYEGLFWSMLTFPTNARSPASLKTLAKLMLSRFSQVSPILQD